MQYGVLPRIDRHILLFERWYLQQLSHIELAEHVMLLRQFTTWCQLPRLHATARLRPIGPSGRNHAAAQFIAATRFLSWLAARDRRLNQATQADIDGWHAESSTEDRRRIDGFLQWAMNSGHMPRLRLPRRVHEQRAPISQQHRLTLLRRALTDEQTPRGYGLLPAWCCCMPNRSCVWSG
jgi:hypothetical protein